MGNAAEASQGEEQRKSGHDVEVSWVVADDVRRLVQEFPVARSGIWKLATGNFLKGQPRYLGCYGYGAKQ